jgi:hypothetical protein
MVPPISFSLFFWFYTLAFYLKFIAKAKKRLLFFYWFNHEFLFPHCAVITNKFCKGFCFLSVAFIID